MESQSHRKIREFIKKRGYSYSVTDVLNGYIKRLDGFYNSYTMNDCLDNLEQECEEVTQEINNIIRNHSDLFR
ncbi:hypothetical protein [Oceanobacillus sp. FSL W7-1281]|uniref:hypothetical protein n=1 Tax=Oceanobacillus sp. FSL W7-1281 TaxID=2921698 RepID=UPI0030D79705